MGVQLSQGFAGITARGGKPRNETLIEKIMGVPLAKFHAAQDTGRRGGHAEGAQRFLRAGAGDADHRDARAAGSGGAGENGVRGWWQCQTVGSGE